ncbi:glycosyltransferase family 4 protein [uncultured Maribacter sp.]|uniref:glycosyltransferase family 4 protein n=1 Tax=uncultured Maribacter sp. TaxID=431308 RepID=UPI002612A2BC|nr:glycosyltransferase family 4 protein [uncultured Maribacter sp.]
MLQDKISHQQYEQEGKPKILFILHIPPPIYGAALVGKFIKDSLLINTKVDADYINLTSSFNLNQIGKGGLAKFKVIYKIFKEVLIALRSKKYDCYYMTLTAKGAGFYKDFLIILLLKLNRCKIIYHFHNKGVAENSKKWYNHFLYKIAFNNVKCILLAPNLYQDIKRYVSINHVFICNNGIPKMTPDTVLNLHNKEVCKFLFLSNMMEEKGVFELLEACKILKDKNLNFNCVFVGAWTDINETLFLKKVKSLGLMQNVCVHGKKYNAERISYLQDADVIVLPTYYHNECFPLVLLEAMQFGLPVISTPEGAISEIVVEGKTGFLTPQKEPKALAEAMEYLLTHPTERITMGKEGKKRYEKHYTIDTFEQRMLEILKATIKSKNSGA